jgi:hypothetical protein
MTFQDRKYEKQDNKGRAAIEERNFHTNQQYRTIGKEPNRTPNKSRRGNKAKHGLVITFCNQESFARP